VGDERNMIREQCSINTERKTKELEEKPVLHALKVKAIPLQAFYRP